MAKLKAPPVPARSSFSSRFDGAFVRDPIRRERTDTFLAPVRASGDEF